MTSEQLAVSSGKLAVTSNQWRKVVRWGVVLLGLLMGWGVLSVPLARWLPLGPEAPPEYPSWLMLTGWLVELMTGYWLLVIRRWPLAVNRWRLAANQLLTAHRLLLTVYCLLLTSLFLASRTLPYHANATTPEAFFDLRPPITRLLSSEFRVSSSEFQVSGSRFQVGEANNSALSTQYSALDPQSPVSSLSVPQSRFLSLSDIFFDVGDQAEIDTIYAGRLSELARFDYTVAIKQKEVVAPNLPLVYGLAAADGFDGGILPLQAYSQLTTLILPPGVVTTDGRLRENLEAVPEARWLDLFNIGYVITDKVGDAWVNGVFFDLQHSVTLTDAAAVGHIPAYEATELWLVAPSGDFLVDITTSSGQTWQLTPELMSDALWRVVFPEPTAPTAISLSACQPVSLSACQVKGLSLVDSRDDSFQPLVLGNYRLIHSGDVKIYENLDVLPRAFLVYEWEAADNAAAALSLMRDPSFDPARQGVVSSDQLPVTSDQSQFTIHNSQFTISPSLSPHSSVLITSFQPEQIKMTVDAAAPALLILTDSDYPGWQATLDGEPVAIHQTDVLFRGVFVPEGEHQLVMWFESESWGRGRVISLISLGLWLLAGLAFRRR